MRNVDLDTLNKRAANYLRVLIFAILLSLAEIAEINTRENMSPASVTDSIEASSLTLSTKSVHACNTRHFRVLSTLHFFFFFFFFFIALPFWG